MVQKGGLFSSLFLVLFAFVVNQLQIPLATCQEEQEVQCLPRKTFITFLRIPEVSSNLAAYSRSARVIQDTRNDFMQLKALSTEDTSDDAKICMPASVYYEIFSDPTMRAHLSAIERALRMIEGSEQQADVGFLESEKRSIATLAKNGDLPASILERSQTEDDEEKRSQSNMSPEELLKMYVGHTPEELGKSAEDIINEYTLPNGELNVEALTRDFHTHKRNIGALARDYALPPRRNIASFSQDANTQYDKRNIASMARDGMLPVSSKRGVGIPFSHVFIMPSRKGKRNIGSLARDFALPPFGKRYLGALVRSGGYPYVYGKRSIASLARNGGFNYVKRNIGTLARDWSLPQSRHSRSLDEQELGRVNVDLQRLEHEQENDAVNKAQVGAKHGLAAELADAKNKSRSKRQIDYSEEYPLPDMQSVNMSDYEDLIEALTGYPVEKRFMGRIPQMGPRPTTPPTRRLGR